MDYSKYPNYVPLDKMTDHDNVPQYIVVHHSASSVDDFLSIQRYHITDPQHLWSNIGYHAVINRDGTLHQGRPDFFHGSHVKEDGMNKKSLGVCLCGDFDKTLPNEAQIATLIKYLREKMALYNIPAEKIIPHRHWATYKSCYGKNLSDDWAKKLVESIPTPAPTIDKTAIKAEINRLVSLL